MPEPSPGTEASEAQPAVIVARRPRLGPLTLPAGLHTFDAFSYRSFRLLFVAVFWASGGYWLQQVVIGWLIYDITRSPFMTSVAMGLEAVPLLIMGPFGGLLVDALNRRMLLTGIYLYQGTLALALGVGVVTGYVGSAQIMTFLLFVGFSWVITEPARASLTANIVPKNGLINAYALSTLGFGITRLGIPALGGVLINIFGAGPTLIVQMGLFYLAAVFAFSTRVEDRRTSRPKLADAISSLVEGVKYVREHRVILALLIFGVSSSMISSPFVLGLIPVYAAEVFDVGPVGLGMLMSASGIGMVIGTFFMASLGDVKFKGKLIVGALVTTIATMAAFSHVSWFGPGLLILVLMSTTMPVIFTATQGSVQAMIPDELRGRISGLAMVTWGAFPFGSLMAGTLAETLGVQMTTLIGAGILAVTLAVLLRVFDFMWQLK